MPLQIVTSPSGNNTVIYTPPHPASIASSVIVPRFSEVESAYKVIRSSSPSDPVWEEAMDTIERFIYTR